MSTKLVSSPPHIVLGAPIFSNSPKLSLATPLGQLELCQAVRKETNDPAEVFHNLALEYMAIAFILREMGIDFKILMPDSDLMLPQMREGVQQESFATWPFPNTADMSALMFPRDLATLLPDGTALIDSSLSREQWLPQVASEVTLSPYGQGGRILIGGSSALVTKVWYYDHDPFAEMDPSLSPLTKAQLKVGLLPNTGRVETNGRVTAYGCDDHIDRTAGILIDSAGKTHVVVDPRLYSGFRSLTERPLYKAKKTLGEVRAACHGIGAELHIPRRLSVPASVGFMQFPTGQVLVTSGDEEVAGIVRDIVGTDQVHETPVPIRYLPAWGKASIRCVIGEWPECLCALTA